MGTAPRIPAGGVLPYKEIVISCVDAHMYVRTIVLDGKNVVRQNDHVDVKTKYLQIHYASSATLVTIKAVKNCKLTFAHISPEWPGNNEPPTEGWTKQILEGETIWSGSISSLHIFELYVL